jgi:hypothetical protein
MSMTMGFRERIVAERLDGLRSVRLNLCLDGSFEEKCNGCAVASGSFDVTICRNS